MMKDQGEFRGFLKSNGLVILTLTVSLFTLFFYIRQTNLLSRQTMTLAEQNKATAWPHLALDAVGGIRESKLENYSMIVRNTGNGPAIVERVVVKIDGVEVED